MNIEDNKTKKTKSDVKIKKFISRIFMFTLMAGLFLLWLFVGLKKIEINYAVYVSIGIVACWIIIAIITTIYEKTISLKSPDSGKPYVAGDFGVMAAVDPDDANDNDKSEKL